MTLACEDGHQIKAHIVILAGSSPFFENLLRSLEHSSHPLIYMRGVKSEDLNAIVDFLYRGEANVFEDNLDSFLAIAEELKLKGLTGGGKPGGDEVKDFDGATSNRKVDPVFKMESSHNGTAKQKTEPVFKKEALKSSQSRSYEESLSTGYDRTGGTVVAQTKTQFSGDLQELDEKSNSMMEKTSEKFQRFPLYKCKVCGKKAISGNLKKHIEANHLEGVSVPCNNCEKIFMSRNALAVHTYTFHKNKE